MRARKMALIAALLAVSTVQPASAADYQKNGFNNGEVGFVSLTWGLGVEAGADTMGFPDVADGKVHAQCEFYEQGRPSSNDVLLVLEGHAHAEPDGANRATSVGLECELRDEETGDVVASSEASNEGSQYVQAPPTVVASSSDSYTVCTKTTVHWADNTVTENTLFECEDPQ